MPTNTDTIQLDLDIAADSPDELLACLAALTDAAPGLTYIQLTAVGPASWPVYRFDVHPAFLQAFAEAYGLD